MIKDEMMQAAHDWDGTNVSDVLAVSREAIAATLREADKEFIKPHDVEWFGEFVHALDSSGHPELWPEDLSDAFRFIAIDVFGRALVTESDFSGLHISVLLDDEDDEDDGSE
ncbi:MAG: hypothetical protein NUV50_03890 [Rhodospirillales bacterium]|nr:hypothetical protein [Rhodospirillales bacterium]